MKTTTLEYLHTRLLKEQERLRTAKAYVRACDHPDDLVDLAGRLKAQAARVNLLEDMIYELENPEDIDA